MIRTNERSRYGQNLVDPRRSFWSGRLSFDSTPGWPPVPGGPWSIPAPCFRDDEFGTDELISTLAAGRGRLVLVTGQRGVGRSHRAMAMLERARSVCDVVLLGHHGLVEGVVGGDPVRPVDEPSDTWTLGQLGGELIQGVPIEEGSGGAAESLMVVAEDVDPAGDVDRTGPGPAEAGADGTQPAAEQKCLAPAPGLSASLSLVRAVARVRPDGPAARLAAEVTRGTGSAVDMTEELALVLVAEAAYRPIAVLLDDVHLTDDALLTLVDYLLTVVDTVPLLLVATAATGRAACSPHAQRWRGWVGQHGVQHAPVFPLPRAELVRALRQLCRSQVPESVLDTVVRASRGNPRIAQEIVLWTLEGSPADAVPATSLVSELVIGHEQDGILSTVAIAGMPVDVRLIARATSTSTSQVRHVLEEARAAGVVDRYGAGSHSDTYTLVHPIYAAAARSLFPADRVSVVHLAISSALIDENGDDPAVSVHIARHLVASGHSRSDTPQWCLRAATWCETGARLREVTEFAQAGLDADPDLATRMQLTAILARAYRRLGEHRSAAGVLRGALRLVSGQPCYSVPLAVELLELRELTCLPGAGVLLGEVKAVCPPDRPDLLARVTAVEAAMTFRRDPARGRRAAGRAVLAADSADDTVARVQALTVAAQMVMEPAQLTTLERLSSQLMLQPGVGGLAAAAAAALAGADRARLDFVLREYTWRESCEPDQVTRDELALLKGVVAALDGRKAVLSEVLLSLSRTTTPHVALAAALLPMLWTLNTRTTLRASAPDITGLPGAELVSELQWLGRLAVRASAPHPAEIDLVKQRLGDPEELANARPDGSWAVRLAATAFLGAASRDRDLCAGAVRCLEPFADQFLVLWPYLPVGPVGWYLARALRVLGRDDEAASALDAAQAASAGLGAAGWSLRVAAEQARGGTTDTTVRVADVVRRSIGPGAARRFAGVVAEIRCCLSEEPAGTGLPGGTVDPQMVARIRPGVSSGVPGPGQPSTPEGLDGGDGRSGAASFTEPRTGAPALSQRESDIMALAAVGCTNQEIAKRLFLSVATVERHCTNLYRRLGVRNRAQALGVLGRLGPSDNA